MKKCGSNNIFAAAFLALAIGNSIDCFLTQSPFIDYLLYSGPFLVLSPIFFFLRESITKKGRAWILIIFSILAIIAGDHGNLTGAMFLCFSLFIFANTRIIAIAITAAVIAIIGKAAFSGWTVSQSINYIIGMIFVVWYYWNDIHPKPLKSESPDLDYETMEVIKLTIQGIHKKEIADRMDITDSGVSKKLKRARDRMNARSDMELAIILSSKGHIVL